MTTGEIVGGSDIGLGQRGGCLTVTRLPARGSEHEISRDCDVPLAPDGANAVGRGVHSPVAQCANLNYVYDAHWLSEDEVLLSVPAGGYQPDGESMTLTASGVTTRARHVHPGRGRVALGEGVEGPVGAFPLRHRGQAVLARHEPRVAYPSIRSARARVSKPSCSERLPSWNPPGTASSSSRAHPTTRGRAVRRTSPRRWRRRPVSSSRRGCRRRRTLRARRWPGSRAGGRRPRGPSARRAR